MCNHTRDGNSICYIIPPHMLDHMMKHAEDEAQRDRALHNIHMLGQLRGLRLGMSQMGFHGLSTGTLRRTVYDAGNRQRLPGRLVRSEGGGPTGDVATNEAYDASGTTYNFYLNVYRRNSIDGRGMRIDSSVHFGVRYDNAFFNGQQMVYGDGDGRLFGRFTQSLDVIGHELTHGVTQFSAGLEYQDQSGALNESMSDVFGSLIKQYALNQTADQADWLIGQGLLIPRAGSNRTALRSLKAPGTAYDDSVLGKDPQPAHIRDYFTGEEDNGGVHINSGIPNHAFYLAAVAIGGHAWEVAGRIWYEALTTRLSADSQFDDAAAATRDIAQRRFGASAFKAVDDGWKAVGL